MTAIALTRYLDKNYLNLIHRALFEIHLCNIGISTTNTWAQAYWQKLSPEALKNFYHSPHQKLQPQPCIIITFTDNYPYAHKMYARNTNRSLKMSPEALLHQLRFQSPAFGLTKASVESAWKTEDCQCHFSCFWIHCIERVYSNIVCPPLSFLKGDLKSTVVAADRSEAWTLSSCTKSISNTTTASPPIVTY